MRILILPLLSLCTLSTLANEDVSFKTHIFIDADYLGPFYQKESNENTDFRSHLELASLKSSLKYDISQSIKAKFQIEYKKESEEDYKDELKIDDFYLKYDLNGTSAIKFGQFKEPMGHERLMGSSSLPVIERSMVTSALAPGRNPGIAYEFGNQSTTFHIGYFQIEDDDFENGSATTGRITYGTSFNENIIHFGASASMREFDDSLFQIKEHGEVNTADNIMRSARYYASSQDIYQGELGMVLNDIWIMGEVYQTSIVQDSTDTWLYQGFYVQASGLFNLTKVIKKEDYKYKNGEFDKRKVKSGDIEWVVRYTGLNLRDKKIGSEASSLLLGINYYFNHDTSVMFDYLKPDISGSVVNTNQSGQAISIRLKYLF